MSSRAFLLTLIVPACVLLAAVVDSARRAVGMPFPSVLVAADGGFVTFFLPGWGTTNLPIRHGDPVLAVDGVAVSPQPGELPGRAVYRLVADARQAGRHTVVVDYLHHGARRRQALPLRTMGAAEVSFFAVLTPLAACLYLASGLLAHRLVRHPAAQAYLCWCVGIFIILSTVFDYTTVARLQPAFPLGVLLVAVSCMWAAYTFPQTPASPWLRRGMWALTALFGGLMVWAGFSAFEADQSALRTYLHIAGLANILALLVTLVLRLWLAPAALRAPLLHVTWILAPVLLFGSALLAGLLYGNGVLTWALPFVLLMAPLTVDYALLRQSTLNTARTVDRRVLVIPSTLWAVLWGITAGWLTRALEIAPERPVVVPAAVATAVALTIFALQRRLADRVYFSAAARFRPTIVQLGDALATLTDRRAILDTLEAHVTGWLGVPGTRVLEPEAYDAPEAEADLDGPRTHAGGVLRVPMRCQGELQGTLEVPALPQSAPHTHDDLALLETVASLGALALHHARVVSELESLRRADVGASRDDRELALGRLSEEVRHEVGDSINYFRFLLERAGEGNAPSAKDLEMGHQEIERLQRMIASLRRVGRAPLVRVPVRLLGPLEWALGLLRDRTRERPVEVDVPSDLVVMADHDALVQVFSNLLRNALQASEDRRVGVRAVATEDGVTLDVWDTGPGVPPDLVAKIFNPWVTTKKQGLGLGLAITERLVHALHWKIAVLREGDRTVFRLRAPLRACDDDRRDPGEAP
jgi:signal transduction histidine kinase